MHVPLNHACRTENFATYGIAKNVRMQPLAQAWSLPKLDNAIVLNNACTAAASLKRNDPDPPTASE